jgi:hypothetical protein
LSSIGTELARSSESLKVAIPALLCGSEQSALCCAQQLVGPPLPGHKSRKAPHGGVCSRILLNKSISGMQYLSLLVLALDVAVVQWNTVKLSGFLRYLLLVLLRGLPGVYFEKMLKSTQKVSVYMRNSQLAMWSILLGLIPVFLHDLDSIRKNGFFQGYDKTIMTGLVVAFVMKYGDTILKGPSCQSLSGTRRSSGTRRTMGGLSWDQPWSSRLFSTPNTQPQKTNMPHLRNQVDIVVFEKTRLLYLVVARVSTLGSIVLVEKHKCNVYYTGNGKLR